MQIVARIAYAYWLGLAAMVIAVTVTYLLMRSRLGVPVIRGKRIVYIVAAAGCALVGGLLAVSTMQVKPDSVFSVKLLDLHDLHRGDRGVGGRSRARSWSPRASTPTSTSTPASRWEAL
jgi:hypothetical protein